MRTRRRSRSARRTEIDNLDAQLARRDRARERLLQRGLAQPRESAGDALERWTDAATHAEREGAEARAQADALDRQLSSIADRKLSVSTERAGHEQRVQTLEADLEAALQWRDRLCADPLLQEIEGTDQPSLEAAGLHARILARADLARRKMLDSRVEGTEEVRSLEWLRVHGLLPSPLDVRRVVDALDALGITGYPAAEYLAQNVAPDRRRALIEHDPARFSGVIVLDEATLARARELVVDGLRAPVQISVVRSLDPAPPDDAVHVIPPDPGLYDHTAADEQRPTLEASVQRRDEAERALLADEARLRALAEDVSRFLAAHGDGGIDALDRMLRDTRDQIDRANRELNELKQQEHEIRERRRAIAEKVVEIRNRLEHARQAEAAVRSFVEEHELDLEHTRERKQRAALELRNAAEEEAAAIERAKGHRTRAVELRDRLFEHRSELRRLVDEHDAVVHFVSDATPTVDVDLARARADYDAAKRQYERELREDKIQWEIEQAERKHVEARDRYARAAKQLDVAHIDRLAARDDLDDETARLKADQGEQRQTVADRRATHAQAKMRLQQETAQRREADDLPPDRPRPTDAATARAEADADGPRPRLAPPRSTLPHRRPPFHPPPPSTRSRRHRPSHPPPWPHMTPRTSRSPPPRIAVEPTGFPSVPFSPPRSSRNLSVARARGGRLPMV